jgi:hypothetical protein
MTPFHRFIAVVLIQCLVGDGMASLTQSLSTCYAPHAFATEALAPAATQSSRAFSLAGPRIKGLESRARLLGNNAIESDQILRHDPRQRSAELRSSWPEEEIDPQLKPLIAFLVHTKRPFITHSQSKIGRCEVLAYDPIQQSITVQPLDIKDETTRKFSLKDATKFIDPMKKVPSDLLLRANQLKRSRARIIGQNPEPVLVVQKAEFLHSVKLQWLFKDLARVIEIIISERLDIPDVQGWLALGLQRNWDGISDTLRENLSERLLQASKENADFNLAKATALRRRFFSSLTTDEMRVAIPKDLERRWGSMQRKEREYWIRIAVRKILASNPERTFAPAEWVREKLKLSPIAFRGTAQLTDPMWTALSVETPVLSEAQLLCHVYEILKSPTDILDVRAMEQRLGKRRKSLAESAAGMSKRMTAVFLAERFRLFDLREINEVHANEFTRLLYNKLGRPDRVNKLSSEEPAKLIRANLARRPVLPEPDGALRGYFRDHRISLTLDPKAEPSDREKKFVNRLLERFAYDAYTSVSELADEDFIRVHVQLEDRSAAMKFLFDPMQKMNRKIDSGYSTAFFIRMRYGLAPKLKPVSELTTIDEFKQVLDLNAFPEWIPWGRLNKKMLQALIYELMKETGKPAFWLTEMDYNEVPLRRLKRSDGRPFTLRNLFLFNVDRVGRRSDHYMPFTLLEWSGMVNGRIKLRHPVEWLTTSKQFKQALDHYWLDSIPWGFVWFHLMDEWMKDVARAVRKVGEKLTARDFEKYPIPKLASQDPNTKELLGPKMRGLFAYFARKAPDDLNVLTFLHREVRTGLLDEEARWHEIRQHPKRFVDPVVPGVLNRAG